MPRWTRLVIRFRFLVLALWACALVAGFVANSHLAPLLSNTFTVPGTDSERVRTLLEQHYGDRSDGSFTVVFSGRGAGDGARLERVLARAARTVPSGRATELRQPTATVAYA